MAAIAIAQMAAVVHSCAQSPHFCALASTQGLLMIGPVLHYWYGLNASIAPGAGTGAALIRLVSLTALPQLPGCWELVSACWPLTYW